MYTDFIKMTAVSLLNAKGKALRNKDANDVGADDAGGRALQVLATAVESVDFEHISDAKSLKNIGKTLVAIGERLQEESAKAESGK